ncbi:flavoprotein, partial [Staphylococcus hyicus]|uniref:flavoprotein n=1 Tax=Staphylococcus hyicus TaxID=1284 RepID=UPI000D4C5BCE
EDGYRFIEPGEGFLACGYVAKGRMAEPLDITDMVQHHFSEVHISLGDWADLIIIAPATANTISKLAHGLADDIVTSTLLATST